MGELHHYSVGVPHQSMLLKQETVRLIAKPRYHTSRKKAIVSGAVTLAGM